MRPAEKYVLKPFKREKDKEVETAINKAVDALDSIIVNGLNYTMNYFN
jgi:peptidyl-tRNA hydrolase